jgi:hypothetical protein
VSILTVSFGRGGGLDNKVVDGLAGYVELGDIWEVRGLRERETQQC